MTVRKRERLFVLNDPHALRINAALAMEIGLNESVVLLQIEFLISISDNVHEDKHWTYQSLADLRDGYFPFWSTATISRSIKSLVERELIIVGNFNRVGFDRTQWFALNPEGIARLSSLHLVGANSATSILQNETSILHPAKWTLQDATSILQDETTIPETTSETTSEENVREFRNSKDAQNRETFSRAFEGTRFDPKRRREGAD